MKNIICLTCFLAAFSAPVRAAVPAATLRWNFNQTNINSTNYIFPTIANGTVPEQPASRQGVLRSLDGAGASVNVLGGNGSGVSSGLFPDIPNDRAITVPGVYGANSYIVRTPDDAHAITNLGVITNFTITCWTKFEGSQGAFPRIVMFGPNGQDAGSAGLNAFGILFFNQYDLQLKVHNAGGNGISTSTLPLASAATNWVFIAVTYDGAADTTVNTNNTVFYVGNRTDSFLSPALAPGVSIIPLNYNITSINSVAPGSANSPGYINFDPNFPNGDGATFGVTNVYVAMANRYNGTAPGNGGGNRAFSGRYDDIRLFVNKVLTAAEVEAVRTNAPIASGGPLIALHQPQSTTVVEGQGTAFSIETTEAANRTYQWYVIPKGVGGSNAIAGATSQTLYLPNLTVAANNGDKYAVKVTSSDPASGTLFSSYATLTVVPANQQAVTPGMLKLEYFAGANGNSVANFLANPSANFSNNTPDLTAYLPSFDSRTVFPDNSHENYFVQISGWITPQVTTNYVFFVRAGDQAQLFLSSDDTTNNFIGGLPIAVDTRNGAQAFFGPETTGALAGTEFSTPILLQAGRRYAVLAYLKASAGQDLVQVAWRTDSGANDLPANDQNLADRLQPIPASSLSSLALPLGAVSITQPPVASPSTTVPANSRVTFTVGVSAVTNTGNGPLVVQWQKNGTNIAGATGTSHTTPYLSTADNGSQYRAVVSFPGVSSNSQPVTLTVNADNVAPAVVSAAGDDSMNTVTVRFSEPVDAATGLASARYTIPGLAVLGVAYAQGTNLVDNPTFDTVKLTTSLQADNTAYTVTANGVKDRAPAGNTIGAANSASFKSLGFASGFAKFEYFENQNHSTVLTPSDDNTVNGLVSYSPKFVNNDPDTIVYPRTLAMSPEGQVTFRSGGAGVGAFPAIFGTRMSTVITPTNTANYVFYLAADDTAILWLSTNANPANKRVIAYASAAAGFSTEWSAVSSATTDTNTLISTVTVPGAAPWPVADANGIAVINLRAGQRYYLEGAQRETAGGASFVSVNWDGGTGVAPANGSASTLTGNLIGWHFTQPQITSIAKVASNVAITWTSALGPESLGAVPWPGIVAPETAAITPSFPVANLASAPVITGPFSTLTNAVSPATIPATNDMQFFRLGQ